MSCWAESRIAALKARTMARLEAEGNRLSRLFQRLLRCLCAGFHVSRTHFYESSRRAPGRVADRPDPQLFSSGVIFLANSSNEVSPLSISPLMKKVGVEL